MRPPRIRIAPAIPLSFACAILLFADSLAPLRASAASRRKAPPIAEEKQRVPKEKPREKPATGTTSTGSSSSSTSEESDADCVFGCLGALFDGSSSSTSSSVAASPGESFAAAPHGWAVYDHGWLRAKTPGDSLMLFESPVEAGRTDVPVGALPDGAEIVVEELHVLPSGLELRVRPADRMQPFGWIASDVVSPTRPPGPPAPIPPRSTNYSLHLALGGGGLLNTDLDEEYGNGGFHGEIHYQNYPVGNATDVWMWSVGAGYWDFKGNPVVMYIDPADPARSEEPMSSTMRITSFSLEGGGRGGTVNGFRFTGAIGPALFYVSESATVRTVVDSTGAVVDTRSETLHRTTGGGVARMDFGWRFASGFEIGVQIDGYVIAWNGRHEKSLTSDFLDGPIGGLDAAFELTFPAP